MTRQPLIQNSRINRKRQGSVQVSFDENGKLCPIVFRKHTGKIPECTTYQIAGEVIVTARWNNKDINITVSKGEFRGEQTHEEAFELLCEINPWLKEFCTPSYEIEGRPIPTHVWDPRRDLSYKKKRRSLKDFCRKWGVKFNLDDAMIAAAKKLNLDPVDRNFNPDTYKTTLYQMIDPKSQETVDQTETWYGCSGHGHAVALEINPRIELFDGVAAVELEEGGRGIKDWQKYRYLVRVRTRIYWDNNKVLEARGTAVDVFRTQKTKGK